MSCSRPYLSNLAAVVLAAGKGTRMKSSMPKVMHLLLDEPILSYPLSLISAIGIKDVVVVVGHGAEYVRPFVEDKQFMTVFQAEQLGTAHAVTCALSSFSHLYDNKEYQCIIMCGDMPLLKENTFSDFISWHKDNGNVLSVMSSYLDNPYGYGRIIRDSVDGRVLRVVEERDASLSEKEIKEVNTGTYIIELNWLKEAIGKIGRQNAQAEFYFTDIIELTERKGKAVGAYILDDKEEALGINSRIDLSIAEEILLKRNRLRLMANGVTLLMPHTIYIGNRVKCGQDVIIEPFSVLMGDCNIGDEVRIGAFSYLKDVCIKKGEYVPQGSVLKP